MKFWELLVEDGACSQALEWVDERSLRECLDDADWDNPKAWWLAQWTWWLAWKLPIHLINRLRYYVPTLSDKSEALIPRARAWWEQSYEEVCEVLDIEA